MSVRITYFVHGTSVDNANRISSGWKNTKLSDLGVKQSEDWRKKKAWRPGWEYLLK